ncbi:hypothetical protein [Microbacterium sp. RURRCA19A]|uniref:hypothetical protein n=1 Tax=Microbacterium sp. RURRCA19A TaxID=1907391 RepID=UPI0009552B2A|nr:hypothetical protein [Microbacterium sp. RURRCA19A]SIR73140.1 hypothetical protein SAMN05880568_1205 [Microbacterium sp. RURRCA19A]
MTDVLTRTAPRAKTSPDSSAEKATRKKTITGVLVLPLFLLIALPALFLGLLHSPAPNDMKVAVIGSSESADPLIGSLENQSGDSFEISRVDTVDDARTQVRELDIRGAYDPSTGTIYVGSADGFAAKNVVVTLFTSVAGASGVTASVDDVLPLDEGDPMGTTAMYLGIGAILAGMLAGLILGLFPTSSKVRAIGVIAVPVVAATIEVLYGWAMFDILPGNGFGPGLMIFALSFVTAVVTLGGVLVIGPAMLIVSILLLVLLGITTSGLPLPLDMAPGFYQAMHHVLPTSQGLEALRRLIYVDDYNPGWAILTMGIWAVVGAALVVWGTFRAQRKSAAALAPSVSADADVRSARRDVRATV